MFQEPVCTCAIIYEYHQNDADSVTKQKIELFLCPDNIKHGALCFKSGSNKLDIGSKREQTSNGDRSGWSGVGGEIRAQNIT